MGVIIRNDMAYLAGILDGEGCFSLQLSGHTYRNTIQVSTTSRALRDWLHGQFSGGSSDVDATDSTEELFVWVLASKPKIAELLPHVIPLLIIKRLHASILLEFCQKFNVGKGGTYTEAQYADMHRYHQLLMLANSKGPGSNNIKNKLLKIAGG